MKLLFLGNGPFAVPALDALAQSPHRLLAVVARPDLPQGKHQTIEPGPVAKVAKQLGLPLHQPPDANDSSFCAVLRGFGADLLVVADFGQILSLECLATTRLGGVNIHGSLLPKYRGAAPIAWAVYHGETETGVSIIQVTPQLDAGGLLLQGSIPIGPDETAGELESTLSQLGAQLVLKAVDGLERGAILPKPQDPKLVTKAPRLKKEDGRIHWERTAPQIHNQVRALQPWPIAFTDWHRAQGAPVRLQILRTRPLPASREAAEPGSVGEAAAGRLLVATGAGDLEILELKPAGKKAMDAATFLRGNKLASNDRFS